MSRQNKQRKKAAIAKQFSPTNKGPKGTEPKHGKKKSWAQMGRKNVVPGRKQQKEE
jgi:hypothetical protein